MQPIVRVLGAALAISALVLSASPIAVAAPEGQPAFQVSAIDWKPCRKFPTVDCGFLTLPIDYAKPDGETFQLAVSRRKANDQSQRIGSMVVNPGGPGGSGISFSMTANEYFNKEIVDKFDVIGFDPRGVGSTQPIMCSTDVVMRQPSLYPKNEGEYDKLAAYNNELREDCRKQTGPIFDHASTRDVANDIDAIRRALGEEKISYYGLSYGTIIGQHYAEQYGRNIRAMIIDSNMDHSVGTWKFVESEAHGAEEVFDEWVKWSDRTPTSPFYGKDLRKIWKDLLAKADRGELKEEGGNVITAEYLGDIVLHLTYGPYFEGLASYVATLVRGAPASAKAFAEGETSFRPFSAIFCSDYNLRVSSWGEYQALTAMENRVAPNTRGSSLGHNAMVSCMGYPKATNPQRPLNIKNAPKILMTNAKYDPATPHEWAVNAHQQSRDTTVFVTYEGWGHGVYERSDCTKKINDEYLVSLKLPRNGTTCAAVETPDQASLSVARKPVPAGPFSVR